MSLGLSLISIGQVRPHAKWGMPSHRHDFHELIAVTGGAMTVRFPGATVEARRGTVLFYAAGVPHEEINDRRDPVHTFFISFRCPHADKLVPASAHDSGCRIGQALRELFEERHTGGPWVDAWRGSTAEAALARYLRLASYREPGLVELTRAYMRQHLARSISLDDLASAAGLTRFHFAREYRRLAGRPPMDDLRHLRAEAARDLLLNSRRSPKEVALAVGFANQPHLTRMMRRYLGATPAEIRRKVPRRLRLRYEDHSPQ